MTAETRKAFSQTFDILYEPTNLARNIFGNIRDLIFPVGVRVAINLFTQPQETLDELKSISIQEFRENITSDRFQRILAVNLYYPAIWILIGVSVLKQISDSRKNTSARRKREDLYPESIPNVLEDFMIDLNNQIDAFESSCYL